MSGIPSEIPQYGDANLKPRQNPGFSPGLDFGTEEYFVWSRCDGTVSLHDIILMVGFGVPRSIEILAKLRRLGAVLLPGETQPPQVAQVVEAAEPAEAPGKLTGNASRVGKARPPRKKPEAAPVKKAEILPDPTQEEAAALAADVPMEPAARVRLLAFRRRLSNSTLFEVLGVEPDADKRAIKRAYFRLSKEFHPDRHYGKDLGPLGPWLSEAFKAVNDSFKVLGDNKKRAAYEASLRGDIDDVKPQTREEHAQSLFQQACDAELHGEMDNALKLFAAAIRMGPTARILRRAAMCAVHARKLSTAEDYAKKAVELCARDPSYLRVLADVYRAAARLEEARGVLAEALTLDTENDVLFGELQSDLAAVETALAEKADEEDR